MPDKRESRTANELSPSVVVGVGGVGKEILMRLRRMIVESHGKLSNLPVVQFLHMDTDADKAAKQSAVLGENISLTGAERISLSDAVAQAVGNDTDSVRKNPAIQEWLPENITITQDFAEGAGGVRACGRLAFHYAVGTFRTSLREALRRARDESAKNKVSKSLGMQCGTKTLRLFGLFPDGWHGKRSFMDVAYNARAVLREASDDQAKLIGYYVIGGDGIDIVKTANCYGALKELEYFCTASFQPNLRPFGVSYPVSEFSNFEERANPFSYCFLVNYRNENGHSLNETEVAEMAARNLFLEILPGLSDRRRGRRVDMFGGGQRIFGDPVHGRFQGFSTFGLTVLEFPALRIREMLTNRLASFAADVWRFDSADPLSDLLGQKDQFLRDTRIGEKDLTEDLLNAGKTLGAAKEKLAKQADEIRALIDHSSFDKSAIKSKVDQTIDDRVKYATFDHDPQKCGDAVKDIENRRREILKTAASAAGTKIAAMASNEHEGSRNALQFLDSLTKTLTDLAAHFRGEAERYKQAAIAARAEVHLRKKILAEDLAPRDRWALWHHNERLNQALAGFVNAALKREASNAALTLLAEDQNVGGVPEFCLLSEVESLRSRLQTSRPQSGIVLDREEQARRGYTAESAERAYVHRRGTECRSPRSNRVGLPDESTQFGARAEVRRGKGVGSEGRSGEFGESAADSRVLHNRRRDAQRKLLEFSQKMCDGVKQTSMASELGSKDQASAGAA
ncbi:MAG: tubulin-like doman-containing protein, partial [Acidobacteriota bacterium]|nr:tubulin-like doman-containing protein [Acidobacteriota bacterium]